MVIRGVQGGFQVPFERFSGASLRVSGEVRSIEVQFELLGSGGFMSVSGRLGEI